MILNCIYFLRWIYDYFKNKDGISNRSGRYFSLDKECGDIDRVGIRWKFWWLERIILNYFWWWLYFIDVVKIFEWRRYNYNIWFNVKVIWNIVVKLRDVYYMYIMRVE